LRPLLWFTIIAAKYIPKLGVVEKSLCGTMRLIGPTDVEPDNVRDSEVIHKSGE
jgi:hypothetical protein